MRVESAESCAPQVNWAYHRRVALPVELAGSTSGQLRDGYPSLLVPVGSTEQHGPHLPLDTDTRIAAAVARATAAGLAGRSTESWLVAPAIAYGASGEHQSFPGTVSIGTEVLERVLVEYGRSAMTWAHRLVFVNGHGGNVDALRAAVRRMRFESREVGWSPCVTVGGDAHAGHTETSVMLHLAPADVMTERWQPGNSAPLGQLIGAMRRGGVAAVSEVGVLGDPTTATARDGEEIFTAMVDDCIRRVRAWMPGDDGMLA
ncbi:mycofactocin biosynthesis peptidyl-dipeptidase MftE [Mycolicibacillus trivialis]|uniref:Mycofactocin system creatininase n=1 Tax=Mycolicibacillus trivialis TaxID=1798 RepID=A0A1X2EKD1_9MYCO|nr:mycofactocin biosynthesis peptidyl-dipeptidase MftE [Mycolicibacillus trivialis]ORX05036.1 mycofactocin system creatininase [Mycolicibacillus trivialis]